MDPFVTLPLAALALGKLWAWGNKKHQQDLARKEGEGFEELRQEYQAETGLLMDSLVELGRSRFGYIRTLHREAAYLARRLPRRHQPFHPQNGWFAGKSFRAILKQLKQADTVASFSQKHEKDRWSFAFKAILALQFAEYLDQAGWMETPLHDSLRTTLDLPSAGDIAQSGPLEGLLDIPIADLLSGPLFIFGIWRLARNIELAAQSEDVAARYRDASQELRQHLELVKQTRTRIGELKENLEEAAYELFKFSWLIKARFRGLKFVRRPPPDELVGRFADACRRFSDVLDRRLDGEPAQVPAFAK